MAKLAIELPNVPDRFCFAATQTALPSGTSIEVSLPGYRTAWLDEI
jgi:hypothetical protein